MASRIDEENYEGHRDFPMGKDNGELTATTKRIKSQPYEYVDTCALDAHDIRSKDMVYLGIGESMTGKRHWDMRFKSAFPNW